MNMLTSSHGTTTPPITARRISRIVRWSVRVLLGLLALIAGLALSGVTYEAVMVADDTTRYPPPAGLWPWAATGRISTVSATVVQLHPRLHLWMTAIPPPIH
jgi:hypothetical protein